MDFKPSPVFYYSCIFSHIALTYTIKGFIWRSPAFYHVIGWTKEKDKKVAFDNCFLPIPLHVTYSKLNDLYPPLI
ncbi:MAG: hypothetical protein ABIT35_05465 [Chitinophagaceae bacterium]